MGRPSKFTQKLVDDICRRIAEGESLRTICQDKGMPTRETVRTWLRDKPDFSAQYARAREEQADHYADEIIDIADRAEDAALARLQVDARKWKASKLAPKRYGDKVTQEVTGGDGGPLVVTWKNADA